MCLSRKKSASRERGNCCLSCKHYILRNFASICGLIVDWEIEMPKMDGSDCGQCWGMARNLFSAGRHFFGRPLFNSWPDGRHQIKVNTYKVMSWSILTQPDKFFCSRVHSKNRSFNFFNLGLMSFCAILCAVIAWNCRVNHSAFVQKENNVNSFSENIRFLWF